MGAGQGAGVGHYPVTWDQRSAGDQDDAELCGETCSAVVITYRTGVTVTPHQVTSEIRGQGQSTSSGTDWTELQPRIAARGLTTYDVDWAGAIAAWTKGDDVALLIEDNSLADPAPGGPNRHWILSFALAPGAALCWNPWGNRYMTYDLARLRLADVTLELHAITGGSVAPRSAAGSGSLLVML